MILILTIWALFGVAGYYIGAHKGRGLAGALLGLFLGVFGWVITYFLSPKQETEGKVRKKVSK